MALTISGNDLYIRKGDSGTINLDFNIDITGATVYFTVKSAIEDTENTFQKQVTNHTNDSEGITAISIDSSDTDIAAGEYVYDIQINLSDDQVHTVYPAEPNKVGKLYITKGVS